MAFTWIEHKKQYRQYQARIAKLPAAYQSTVAALMRYITHLGGMDNADSILTMLDDLASLFERAAADGTPVRAIVGEEPVEFAEAFLGNYPAGRWITRERDRLTRAVDLATGEQTPAV